MGVIDIELLNAATTAELEQALAVAEEVDPDGLASVELAEIIESRADRSEEPLEGIELTSLDTEELEQMILFAYHADSDGHARGAAMAEYATREDGDPALADNPIYVVGASDDD